ncbi:MAG: DUF3572 domain-containing protein [Minwuia sp.]|uniref:DUF3572 domain-containing protein n=1 Tax=Minwuia sp. TaxID=2493630 RepID=UPI003A8568CD
MRDERPTIMALNAVQHIAADEHLLSAFVQQAGVTPAEVRDRIMEPEFQAGVMDFIMGDEQLALDFCAAFGHPPESLKAVRRALPGAGTEYY